MSTERCVAQTAIGGRENGFKVTVIAPACCTVDLELEEIALVYLERVVGVRLALSLTDALTSGESPEGLPSKCSTSSEPASKTGGPSNESNVERAGSAAESARGTP
jgi:hypothetical protein